VFQAHLAAAHGVCGVLLAQALCCLCCLTRFHTLRVCVCAALLQFKVRALHLASQDESSTPVERAAAAKLLKETQELQQRHEREYKTLLGVIKFAREVAPAVMQSRALGSTPEAVAAGECVHAEGGLRAYTSACVKGL
jgi:hypothetical protein